MHVVGGGDEDDIDGQAGDDFIAAGLGDDIVHGERGVPATVEFVDIAADLDDPAVPEGEVVPGDFKPAHFSVYDKDWNPKPAMAVVDDNWDSWMEMIRRAAGV